MKIIVTVTQTLEMDIEQLKELYPEGTTPQEILQHEISASENLFHEWIEGDQIKWEHKGEIIE